MAINTDPDIKKRMRLGDVIYLRMKIFILHQILRKCIRFIHKLVFTNPNLKKRLNRSSNNVSNNVITRNLDTIKGYKKNGWGFTDNILDDDLCKEIDDNWPNRFHFDVGRSYYKFYSTGFSFKNINSISYSLKDDLLINETPFIQSLLWYKKLVEYLRSDDLAIRISNICGQKMVFSGGILSDAREGNCVAMHRDSVSLNKNMSNRLQMMIFISSAPTPHSGELCLARDNKWEDIIFTPPSLNNTALLFNKSLNFYHGFYPIARGKFRKAIGATFASVDDEGIL